MSMLPCIIVCRNGYTGHFFARQYRDWRYTYEEKCDSENLDGSRIGV